jgi:hypothetical protein
MSVELSSPARGWVSMAEAQKIARISRSTLYNLLATGVIRNCSLKRPGTVRGRRLISAESLAAYFESMAQGGVPVAA